MGVKCYLLFQKVKGHVFRAGEPVIGKLEYVIDKPTSFERIDIVFVGKGNCFWSESDSDDTRFHCNEEVYTSMFKNIRKDETVQAGTYEYEFEFALPEDLPTSIKTEHCTIKYEVIAIFVKANLFKSTKKFDVEIPVTGYVKPYSPEQLVYELKQEQSSDEMNVKVEIEKAFIAPGEDIILKVTINNDPDNTIKYIKSELIKQLTYVSDTGKTITERGPVRNTKGCSRRLKPGTESIHRCIVPTMPSSCSIQHSKILIGEYKVRITAKYPLFHSDASVEIPVVIGERREPHRVVVVQDGKPYSSTPDESDVNEDYFPVVKLI